LLTLFDAVLQYAQLHGVAKRGDGRGQYDRDGNPKRQTRRKADLTEQSLERQPQQTSESSK